MNPQSKHVFNIRTFVSLNVQHSLPDARQVSQVEHVVELGGRRQHFNLGLLPQNSRSRNYFGDQLDDVLWEARQTEVAFAHDAEDLVDGVVGGERAVEDVEGALESLWDVVAPSSRVNHRSDELQKKSFPYYTVVIMICV